MEETDAVSGSVETDNKASLLSTCSRFSDLAVSLIFGC